MSVAVSVFGPTGDRLEGRVERPWYPRRHPRRCSWLACTACASFVFEKCTVPT